MLRSSNRGIVRYINKRLQNRSEHMIYLKQIHKVRESELVARSKEGESLEKTLKVVKGRDKNDKK